MTAGFHPARLNDYERAVLDGALRFSVCLYRGRGAYEKAWVETIDKARVLARVMYENDGSGQPVVIYAVDHHKTSALVETYDPRRKT